MIPQGFLGLNDLVPFEVPVAAQDVEIAGKDAFVADVLECMRELVLQIGIATVSLPVIKLHRFPRALHLLQHRHPL